MAAGQRLEWMISRIAMVGSGGIDACLGRQMLTDALNSMFARTNEQGIGFAEIHVPGSCGETITLAPDGYHWRSGAVQAEGWRRFFLVVSLPDEAP